MRGVTIALLALVAAAPPPGSEDYEILHPHKQWIESATNAAQGLCCSMADGRVVDAKIVGDHWEVLFLHPETLKDPPIGWQRVPEWAVVPGVNETGVPIGWWYGSLVRCFAPQGGA